MQLLCIVGNEININNNIISWEKIALCQIYFAYHRQTNTGEFITIYDIMRPKISLSIAIITKVSLLGYVIYFSAGVMCISWK